jgi:hypothetical protein
LEHCALLRDSHLITRVADIEASGNHALLEVERFVAWNVGVTADYVMFGWTHTL